MGDLAFAELKYRFAFLWNGWPCACIVEISLCFFVEWVTLCMCSRNIAFPFRGMGDLVPAEREYRFAFLWNGWSCTCGAEISLYFFVARVTLCLRSGNIALLFRSMGDLGFAVEAGVFRTSSLFPPCLPLVIEQPERGCRICWWYVHEHIISRCGSPSVLYLSIISQFFIPLLYLSIISQFLSHFFNSVFIPLFNSAF